MELVQLFEDKYKHVVIRSVWLIEKSKETMGFKFGTGTSGWDTRSRQLLRLVLELLQGIN